MSVNGASSSRATSNESDDTRALQLQRCSMADFVDWFVVESFLRDPRHCNVLVRTKPRNPARSSIGWLLGTARRSSAVGFGGLPFAKLHRAGKLAGPLPLLVVTERQMNDNKDIYSVRCNQKSHQSR